MVDSSRYVIGRIYLALALVVVHSIPRSGKTVRPDVWSRVLLMTESETHLREATTSRKQRLWKQTQWTEKKNDPMLEVYTSCIVY